MIVGYFSLGNPRKRCGHKFEIEYFCVNHYHDEEDDFPIIWCTECNGYVSVENGFKNVIKETGCL